MILADTSIWIDHLRHHNPTLAARLEWEQIVCHPAVIGELACGVIRDRGLVLGMLRDLPQIMEAQTEEVMTMIERNRLMGCGIGWIDAHLLASSLLNEVDLWTLDRQLRATAIKLDVHVSP